MRTPGSIGLWFVWQPYPVHFGLVCSFCSSGQDFASDFLQIPPRNGHPCLWLTLPTAKCVRDLHPIDIAHAGRTTKKAEMFISAFL
ncbi:MAG TPA: hypothetical protein DDY13_01530 [Cytophagales bacterium]|nr:hypothetical protein [Cytophagales bacterium]